MTLVMSGIWGTLTIMCEIRFFYCCITNLIGCSELALFGSILDEREGKYGFFFSYINTEDLLETCF